MKNFNIYILEKLVINKDSKLSNSDRDNTEILKDLIKLVEEYFTQKVGKINQDWDYKIDKYSHIRVYIYEGSKDDWQDICDDFWKKYYKYDHNNPRKYDDENLFYEVTVTNYGLKIRGNYLIDLDPADLNKVKFRK